MRVSSYDPIWTSACAFSHVPILDSGAALASQDQRHILWTVLQSRQVHSSYRPESNTFRCALIVTCCEARISPSTPTLPAIAPCFQMTTIKNPLVEEMEQKVRKASKASEAVNAARQQLLKAKVQFDNMLARWKKTVSRVAFGVVIWEAYRLKSSNINSFEECDLLHWAHIAGLLLAFCMMAGPLIHKYPRLRLMFRYNKESITALFALELCLFVHNTYSGLNGNIFAEENVSVPNPNRHHPFASLVYSVALLTDMYMVRQNETSFAQFQTVDKLYRELLEREGKEAESKSDQQGGDGGKGKGKEEEDGKEEEKKVVKKRK